MREAYRFVREGEARPIDGAPAPARKRESDKDEGKAFTNMTLPIILRDMEHKESANISISLRLPVVEDVPIYFQYLQNPKVTIWLEDACQYPMTYPQIENFVLGPAWFRRAIEFQGRFIGMTGLEEPDLARGVARFFFVIGDPALWGKGLGEAVLREVIHVGFTDLGLRKIVSNCLAPNEASLAVHKKLGFEVEGCLREDAWRNGQWVDHLLLALRQTDED
ncbi:GNAT family protein [Magnetovibrio sp. PR-2]|uniref:GNAT family N-acetyltransferase n=1 Tax=Magnetovibrio sp. PR-2 TaxID=3120356 RepID=UPI002FCE3996